MRSPLTTLPALLFLLAGVSVGALEAGATYRIESLAFENDRARTDTAFSGTVLPMGFSLYASEKLQEELTLNTEYAYDEVLRNILTGLVTYDGNLFSFGVGPFLGFFNTNQLWPKVGVASVFKIEWPGIAFVQLWLDNSTGNLLSEDGDYLQERNYLSVGFHVPNAICSVNILTRRFAEKTAIEEIADQITEYSFSADIYRKNVPFKIVLTFGLQDLSREWTDASGSTTHSMYSLFLGTRFDIEINDAWDLMFDVDSSIYSFGGDELLGISNPGPLGGYLFRAVAGVTVDVDRLIR